MLTREERERYDRQIMIYGFGEEGQARLKRAKVLIAGGGGLGSPVAIYLAAAGIGMIRVVDHGRVELSNLNRQVLHWDKDIGRSKVDSTLEKLKQLAEEYGEPVILRKKKEYIFFRGTSTGGIPVGYRYKG